MNDLKTVIVGVDFSLKSLNAVKMAKILAEKNDALLKLIKVIEHLPKKHQAAALGISEDEIIQTLISQALEHLNNIKNELHYEKSEAVVEIGDAAKILSNDCDSDTLTVVGITGRITGDEVANYGSTTYKLMRSFPCKLLIVNDLPRENIKKVAVAISTDRDNTLLLEQSKRLSQLTNCEIDIVSTYSTLLADKLGRTIGEHYRELLIKEEAAEVSSKMDEAISQIDWQGTVYNKKVLHGAPGIALVKYARDEDIDVMIMGYTRAEGISSYILSNTVQQVIAKINCSVLLVRPDKKG
ncbi:MAG: universal stress protein [Armatimonadota bacterium]